MFSDFSLSLQEAEHVAILGPNGAGKSTFLKLLAGEVHPMPHEHTRLRLFGEERWNVWDVRKSWESSRHDLQRDYMICAEGRKVVLSGFYASNDTYDHQTFTQAQVSRANDVMRELGIESSRRGHLRTFSTGEQRRFLFGRALVHDPPVLVLDEPTSGLDLKARFQYLDLVRAQIRKGKTVLLVTHHLHEIPPEIDRVIFLKGDKFMRMGTETSVLTPRQPQPVLRLPVSFGPGQRLVSSAAGVMSWTRLARCADWSLHLTSSPPA